VTVTSYEGLLQDPQVDAVYNALPNHLHVPWSLQALAAGKPVFCEKPVALTVDDLDRLAAAAARTGLYVYDGFMVRFHPQWAWLRALDIGRLTQISAHFSYPPQPDGNIRNYAAWGGGPVWDIGGYCLIAGQMLFGGTPRLAGAAVEGEAHLDVERSSAALVDFGDGQFLTMSVSSGSALSQMVHVVGTDGWARLDVPFNPPPETTARWAHHDHGKDQLLGPGRLVTFPACDQYQLMVEDFVEAVNTGRPADLAQARDLAGILSSIVAT
jgi:predicted dehydrogenase